MSSAHHEREARNPFNSARVHNMARLGTGSSKVLIFVLKRSDTKLKKKKNSRSKFGGGRRACCAPLDPPLQILYLLSLSVGHVLRKW